MLSALFFFFFKQKTAYEMRISDWSSDVCSSDLSARRKMQVTPSRTVHRMDNDARTGNSSLAVRRMHDDSQQPLTTDCRTTRRSALAAGTLLLLLCVPALGVAAQATQPRVLTAQPPPERAVAGNYIGEPGIQIGRAHV